MRRTSMWEVGREARFQPWRWYAGCVFVMAVGLLMEALARLGDLASGVGVLGWAVTAAATAGAWFLRAPLRWIGALLFAGLITRGRAIPILMAGALFAVIAGTGHWGDLAVFGHVLRVASVAGVFVGLTWWVYDRLVKTLSSAEEIDRQVKQSRLNNGTESGWNIQALASVGALRRKATIVSPSLRGLGRFALRRVPRNRFALHLVTTGWSLLPFFSIPLKVYVSPEAVVMRLGGPGTGKTQSLAPAIEEAPGVTVIASTKTDLLEMTRVAREKLGRVDIFNPLGLGGIQSTVRWTPLAGCDDFGVATRRAAAMAIERAGQGQFFSEQARRVLALLLHAAALVGGSMRTVAAWNSQLGEPQIRAEIKNALRGTDGLAGKTSSLDQISGTNLNTLTSTTTTIAAALIWLDDERCAVVGDARLDDPLFFDVRRFIEDSRDSLYLVGSPDTAAMSPLLSALVEEVGFQLRDLAASRPGQRLDPHASFYLDEVTLACGEVPVDQWTAYFRGLGVHIELSAQSEAQLVARWGQAKADSIFNNVSALMVWGGVKSRGDLDTLANLVGTRLQKLDEDDDRMVPTLEAADISSAPGGRVLVLIRSLRPILGYAPEHWRIHKSRPVWLPTAPWSYRKHLPAADNRVLTGEVIDVHDQPESRQLVP